MRCRALVMSLFGRERDWWRMPRRRVIEGSEVGRVGSLSVLVVGAGRGMWFFSPLRKASSLQAGMGPR